MCVCVLMHILRLRSSISPQVLQPEAPGSPEGAEDNQRLTQGGAADHTQDPADAQGSGCHHQHQQGQESLLV